MSLLSLLYYVTALAQLISLLIRIKHVPPDLLGLHSVVLDHPGIHPHVVTLDSDRCFWRKGVEDEVVVAVGAVLVGFFKLLSVLTETLFALFTGERHVELLKQGMVFLLLVAFYAIEPFSAAGRSDRDLGV